MRNNYIITKSVLYYIIYFPKYLKQYFQFYKQVKNQSIFNYLIVKDLSLFPEKTNKRIS